MPRSGPRSRAAARYQPAQARHAPPSLARGATDRARLGLPGGHAPRPVCPRAAGGEGRGPSAAAARRCASRRPPWTASRRPARRPPARASPRYQRRAPVMGSSPVTQSSGPCGRCPGPCSSGRPCRTSIPARQTAIEHTFGSLHAGFRKAKTKPRTTVRRPVVCTVERVHRGRSIEVPVEVRAKAEAQGEQCTGRLRTGRRRRGARARVGPGRGGDVARWVRLVRRRNRDRRW